MRPLICLYATLATGLFAQAPQYTIQDLGPLSGPTTSNVTAISKAGHVVGYSTIAGQRHAFRTAPNQPIHWSTDDLGSLGGGDTMAWGVNSLGQAVGQSLNGTGATRGFRTAPNEAITASSDIGSLGSGDTRAFAINDTGQVTGDSGAAFGHGQAFRTAPNSPINPSTDGLTISPSICPGGSTCPVSYSRGSSINSAGDVGGTYLPPNGNYELAFVDRNGVGTGLPFVHAPQQSYTGISENGAVAANANFTDLSVWQDGAIRTLLAGCFCAPIYPYGINASLQVLAQDVRPGSTSELVSSGVVYPLVQLLTAGSGWTNLRGVAINDAGQIAGTGSLNGELHAFRMDPVRSPEQLLTQLLVQIEAMHLPKGRATSLKASVNAALAATRDGKTDDARQELYAFENKVRAQRGKDLTQEQADQLIAAAEAAIQLL